MDMRRLIRYTVIETSKGLSVFRCTLKQRKNGMTYIINPDGSTTFFSGRSNCLDEKELHKVGFFRTPTEALSFKQTKIKSQIRGFQKAEKQAKSKLAEVRNLIRLYIGKASK